jgi:hypothetical protein
MYEEWIYGHVPQTVRFVRFTGDRVIQVKICALGKPIEVHNTDETGGYLPPLPTRQIAMGDGTADPDHPAAPPSLRRPGEPVPANAPGKVQYPGDSGSAPMPIPASAPVGTPPGKMPSTSPMPQVPPGPSTLVGASVAENYVLEGLSS